MIDESKANLKRLGIADQFELICADIFDESFCLPEKVDCVVLSYTLTCFINKRESLVEILRQCSKQIKDDGYILITDFSYPNQPKEDWFFGMYTATQSGLPPRDFEEFQFFISTAGEKAPFNIYHIPVDVMASACVEAGFKTVTPKSQYPNPEFESHPVIRKYIDVVKMPDYLVKARLI
jgi:SAM-dependent methyltransferase